MREWISVVCGGCSMLSGTFLAFILFKESVVYPVPISIQSIAQIESMQIFGKIAYKDTAGIVVQVIDPLHRNTYVNFALPVQEKTPILLNSSQFDEFGSVLFRQVHNGVLTDMEVGGNVKILISRQPGTFNVDSIGYFPKKQL